MNNNSKNNGIYLSGTKEEAISSSASELLQVFENMKTYICRENEYDDEEERKRHDKHDKFFGDDLKKIIKIYANKPNDTDACSVLKDNLYLVNDALESRSFHPVIDRVSFFMKTLGGLVLNTPEISDENRINVFLGMCRMIESNRTSLFTRCGSNDALGAILDSKKDRLLERVVCLPFVYERHKYRLYEKPNMPCEKPFFPQITSSEALSTLNYAADNIGDPELREQIAMVCSKSCRNHLVYAKCVNLIMETDIYKDNPLNALVALESIRVDEKDSKLSHNKFNTAEKQLLLEIKQKINTTDVGIYSAKEMGKRLWSYSNLAYWRNEYSVAYAVLSECRDNKELIHAYNKARIKDKPLGSIRLALTKKSTLEKY